MNPTQLQKLEAVLKERGYKKYSKCIVNREDFAWCKSFGIHKDKYGDTTNDYQIAFRIFDWRGKHDNFTPHTQSEIWLTVTMIPTNLDDRLDCDYSLQLDVPDIDMCEAMMEDFFNVAKQYLKER